jgi:hypothetical protein
MFSEAGVATLNHATTRRKGCCYSGVSTVARMQRLQWFEDDRCGAGSLSAGGGTLLGA